jgi:hypothetical protein
MPADSEDVNILGFCDKTALAKIQYQVQCEARQERIRYCFKVANTGKVSDRRENENVREKNHNKGENSKRERA